MVSRTTAVVNDADTFSMILDSHSATQFIKGYKALLLEIDAMVSRNSSRPVLERLVTARAELIKDKTLLTKSLDRVKAKTAEISPAVIESVQSLEVQHWVYLRDTKRYSIFIHPKNRSAFGVLGLTEPLRNLVGSSTVFLEIGLVRYCGYFVCDGLISRVVYMGPSYRKNYSKLYSEIKAEGCFHV